MNEEIFIKYFICDLAVYILYLILKCIKFIVVFVIDVFNFLRRTINICINLDTDIKTKRKKISNLYKDIFLTEKNKDSLDILYAEYKIARWK